MHAIIPVAGMGTRLRPITHTTPKALIPVAGRPVLGHIIDRLIPAGVDRLTLVVGHLGDAIVSWVRSEFPLDVGFVRQESMDGLASAVALAAPRVDDGPTMVVLGDTLFDADLRDVARGACNRLAVCPVDDPSRFGVVVSEGGVAVRLVEKPAEFVSDLAIVGIYLFRSGLRMIQACSDLIGANQRTRGEFQLTDAMQLMIDAGERFELFRVDDWLDCGKPETLLQTNRAMLDRVAGETPPSSSGCIVLPPSWIDPGAGIAESVIGPYASIGPGCRIRGSVVRNTIACGRNTVEGSVLDSSVLGFGASVTSKPASICLGDDSAVSL
ncbi:MAG TPA: sugar phosphate nucleotidyltransferase [Candidatus Fermentibacter daniensis]|nr:sugar phosphate nucleotidyltransferase [Candidatus Fermentibacter daniensis]HOR06603.1 sugar phosphate nucleotidyltransferase [Candidatus Fermentibacter daniensis]HPK50832.1 sugar phosphate nucleotidyltransferase [Candidatus Fermentibacter daniensis]